MSSGRVIVIGSINVDLVVTAPRLPGAGETVIGGDLVRHHGGKGGNQAVAAARLGARVEFVGAVGRDDFGAAAARALAAEGVGLDHLARVERATGVALIVVDDAGENLIAVGQGANGAVGPADVTRALAALAPGPADVLLVCREIPADSVRTALAAARAAGATGILNPAPADALDPETLALADVITPNGAELALLSGLADPGEGARALLAGGQTGRFVAVTLGASGALLVRGGEGGGEGDGAPATLVHAPAVSPVDTVGAGDTFNGALAAGLAAGLAPEAAVDRAVLAATISTLRPGAREGMPTSAELEAFGG